jgi:hypothetical protein
MNWCSNNSFEGLRSDSSTTTALDGNKGVGSWAYALGMSYPWRQKRTCHTNAMRIPGPYINNKLMCVTIVELFAVCDQ